MTAYLASWLTQVWDEDEAAAKAALDVSQVHIPTGDGHEVKYSWMRELLLDGKFQSGWTCDCPAPPTQLLARIAADRKILAWCTDRDRIFIGGIGDDESDPANYVPGHLSHGSDSVVIRLMAQAYADRPGYRDEWAV